MVSTDNIAKKKWQSVVPKIELKGLVKADHIIVIDSNIVDKLNFQLHSLI